MNTTKLPLVPLGENVTRDGRKARECWINVGPQGQLNAPHDDPKEAAAVCAHNYRTALFREVIPGEGDLRRWKDEAMQVLNDINLQEIGKELGLPLGTNIGPQILPKIREYRALLERVLPKIQEHRALLERTTGLVGHNLATEIDKALRP